MGNLQHRRSAAQCTALSHSLGSVASVVVNQRCSLTAQHMVEVRIEHAHQHMELVLSNSLDNILACSTDHQQTAQDCIHTQLHICQSLLSYACTFFGEVEVRA